MATPNPTPAMGCLALFAATALAALLVTLGLSTPLAGFVIFYIPVFVVTAFIVGLVGMPLYWLARRFGQANGWTAVAAGFVTGALFPAFGVLGEHPAQAWAGVAGFGMAGAVGGLSFFLLATAPSAPRRNAAAMFVITTVSTVAAVLIQPYLT